MAERLDPLVRRSGVVLQIGALPELRIVGNRIYLSQILANLVENAIKYSDGCSRWVRMEAGSTFDGEEPYAWVRVEDNGPRIPPQHMPHLFERFYRVAAARSHNQHTEGALGNGEPVGSGLGLSIVQWVAQANGGEVRVESESGIGSVFEVPLPLLS